jgi:hypothetical protein
MARIASWDIQRYARRIACGLRWEIDALWTALADTESNSFAG